MLESAHLLMQSKMYSRNQHLVIWNLSGEPTIVIDICSLVIKRMRDWEVFSAFVSSSITLTSFRQSKH